jgi:hypothetical protein
MNARIKQKIIVAKTATIQRVVITAPVLMAFFTTPHQIVVLVSVIFSPSILS